MEIKGKVHCFFEQSGTFKNEFKKLGIPAEDYDIQNNFGETDHVVDLFREIEDAYEGRPSLFDHVGGADLIVAFFPCIYFSCMSQMLFSFTHKNYKNLSVTEKADAVIKRSEERMKYFTLLVKLYTIASHRKLKMIIENPWSEQTYLKANFVAAPSMVDENRMLRGDYFVKPTAYWFVNCEPTYGCTIQMDKRKKRLCWEKKAPQAGLCSEDRSLISPDYARNFICDFILGKEQQGTQLALF
jgi:hypothetical protein